MSADLTLSDITLFAGNFELSSITATQIPDTFWGWWWDDVNLKMFTVRNRAGILYAVEANPL